MIRKFSFDFKIAFLYLLFGFLWIYFSDIVLLLLIPDESLALKIQTYKGWLFISMSTIFIYYILGYQKRIIKKHKHSKDIIGKYKHVFQDLDIPFAIHEIIANAQNEIVDYRYLYVNRAFEDMVKLKSDFIINSTGNELFPNIQSIDLQLKTNVAITGLPSQMEYYCTQTSKYYSVKTFCPKPKYCASIYLDITLQKQAERELVSNNEYLEALLQLNQNKIDNVQQFWDFALYKAVLMTNSTLGLLFFRHEISQKFILGNLSNELIVEELSKEYLEKKYDNIELTSLFSELTNSQIVNSIEKSIYYTIISPFVSYVTNAIIIPIFNSSQTLQAIGVLCGKTSDFTTTDLRHANLFFQTAWNIVERYNQHLALIEAKIKAEESDNFKSAFLANISHEIRTPMNSIIGFSQLLENEDFDKDKRKNFSQIIQRSCYQLLNTINDILEMSKLSTGQTKFLMQRTSITMLLHEIKESNSMEIIDKGLELVLTIPQPSVEEFYTDVAKVTLILNCLVRNAIKFTPSGSIEIGYVIQENELQFFVKDTGIGIEPKYFDYIFKPFTQLENGISKKYQGSGVGLSLAKGLVELLGGKIWVESKLEKGSTFYFTLPKIL
ncbi:MAG: HAMP domain-containing sensor histidine kinase [Bacteroidales bacterium]